MPLNTMPLAAMSMQQLLDLFANEWYGANAVPSKKVLYGLVKEITKRVCGMS